MAAGAAVGAVAASLPVVIGLAQTTLPKSIDENDYLIIENGHFCTRYGARVQLRGINLNDELFYFKKADMPSFAPNYDIFDEFEERFGRYGARKLTQTYNENFITASDLRKIKALGANCVRIPLRYRNLFKKESCRGEIKFDYLDSVVEACRKAGLYVIFELHSAPGFQNNASAGGSKSKCVLFDSTSAGLEARNAVIKLWTQVAVHFRKDPTVAAFDLLNRPLSNVAGWEEKTDALNKFYSKLYKELRVVDKNRILIMQSSHSVENLPVFDEPVRNVAYGLYSRFNSTFETDSLISKIKNIKDKNIPVIICKLRWDKTLSYTLSALCSNGISWLFGDYKGPAGSSYLYRGNPEYADFDVDKFDAIEEKWTKPLATKNFEQNKELAKILKAHFSRGYMRSNKKEAKKASPKTAKKVKFKPTFNAKIGANLLVGGKNTSAAPKLKEKV